jgi:hypothetical protein
MLVYLTTGVHSYLAQHGIVLFSRDDFVFTDYRAVGKESAGRSEKRETTHDEFDHVLTVCLLTNTKMQAANFVAQAPAHHEPQRRGQKFYADIFLLRTCPFCTLGRPSQHTVLTYFCYRVSVPLTVAKVSCSCLLYDEVHRAYCLREGIRMLPYATHAPDAHGMIRVYSVPLADATITLWQMLRIRTSTSGRCVQYTHASVL